MASMIGLIMLMGIVIKNSILLVVPAVFTYIDDLEHWLKRGMARLRRPAPAVPAGNAGSEQPFLR
jgi:hypothetical protein